MNKYDFPEMQLGPDFAPDKVKNFKSLIDTGLSFVVISMPGVGVSYFLKYLTTLNLPANRQGFARFIHIDLYSLPTLTQHELYKLLVTELGGKPARNASHSDAGGSGIKTDNELLSDAKKALQAQTQKWGKIVIIFSRFDQLKDNFDGNFLSNLQSLTAAAPGKIVEIFTSTKPLDEIASEALSGGNLNFYSEELYFKPYSKNDLTALLKIEPSRPTPKATLEKLLDLAGGHNQLFHILLSSQKQQNLLLDRFVKLQMKELVDYLSYQQRKQIQKIALGKTINEVDDYLLGIGLVKKTGSKLELFIPLLSEYIKTSLPARLPAKENLLFKLLKESLGEIVPKDEIFAAIWGTDNENATDWALDALIYRLRKHPFLTSQGYIIESHKKVGYTLIQT